MQGEILRTSLHTLASHFYEDAVPSQGRYINDSAVTNATGVLYTPPSNANFRSLYIKILSVTALTAFACIFLIKQNKKSTKHRQALAYEVW